MPDISMCESKDCTIKEECYRYKAIPNEFRQDYAEFKQDKDGSCEYFMEIWNKSKENK